MVTFLLDSDILIDFLKGKAHAIKRLETLTQRSIAVSAITVAEVLEGTVDNPVRLQEALKALSKFQIISADFEIAQRFAQERKLLRKAGKLIDNMDLLIASTALVYNLTLITNNTKDFQRIKALKLLTS
jgi:tRNA(fMet)-specific endonuclease VapC